MDFEAIDALRERHAAWRLLRAGNASLILSFLGDFFVEGNRGSSSASEVGAALDDHLYALNSEAADGDDDEVRYPKAPRAYLEDWAATEAGYLRRFYPPGDDEVHYEVTPAFEKAYGWVQSLRTRPFVATESRLHTAVELLRQIVHGTDTDPESRLADLRRRRNEIDDEIAAVEAGRLTLLEPAGVRDRYQQFTSTARELFRTSGRSRRTSGDSTEQHGRRSRPGTDPRAELLAELVGSRSEITQSDQGHSFQAFYDFLLSDARQAELAELLSRVAALDDIEQDLRTQGDPSRLVRGSRACAAHRAADLRAATSFPRRSGLAGEPPRPRPGARGRGGRARAPGSAPTVGLEVDEPGIGILLPFERPLYQRRPQRRGREPDPAHDRRSRSGSVVRPDLRRPGPAGRQHPRRASGAFCSAAVRHRRPVSRSSRAQQRSSATWRSTTVRSSSRWTRATRRCWSTTTLTIRPERGAPDFRR